MTIIDQDEVVLSHSIGSGIKYDGILSSLSFNNFFNSQKNYSRIIDYINKIKKHYSRESGSLFFKNGWYVNQSVISLLCLCTNDQNLENFDFSKSPYKFTGIGFNFQIRNENEHLYLKSICKLNEQLSNKSISNRFNLTGFYRFFYILYDIGGKTLFDTNTIFSVSTHEPILAYSIDQNSSSFENLLSNHIKIDEKIRFQTKYREITVEYNISHLLHFRESLDFLFSKPLFPSLIFFDYNYFSFLI